MSTHTTRPVASDTAIDQALESPPDPPHHEADHEAARRRASITDPARASLLAFGFVEAIALVFYLVVGRHAWFFRDEWDVLAVRGFNWHDLITQHGGHLVALPVAVFRAMYFVFGLRSYEPYQLMTIVLHLTAAALLRAVMRRSGVNPWLATLVASIFAFFGSGSQDIFWAFQIAFSGALVLGLVQLLLADHEGDDSGATGGERSAESTHREGDDSGATGGERSAESTHRHGPIDRRDWFGVIAGLLALLCSGVAVTMVGVVAVSVFVRRGWRAAAFQVLPPAVLYGAWYLRYGTDATSSDASAVWAWTRTGLGGAFDALGKVPFVGWLLAAVLVGGIVLAWRQTPVAERRPRFAMPGAMLLGALGFLVLTGINRAWAGTALAESSRYLHIVVALLLPSLAVAANAWMRARRGLGAIAIVVLLVGVHGNITAAHDSLSSDLTSAAYFSAYERMVRTLPRMDIAREVPRDLRPDLVNGPGLTIGFLLDGAHSGRIPGTRRPAPRELLTYRLRLSLYQRDERDNKAGTACVPVHQPIVQTVAADESFVVRGTLNMQLLDEEAGIMSNPVTFGTTFFTGAHDHVLRAVAGPLTLRVAPSRPGGSLCEAH